MITVLLTGIILIYLGLIGALVIGFDRTPDILLGDIAPQTRFTVIIPFRNEANCLPQLLESITELNYPQSHYEIIFVDDASNDSSQEFIQSFISNSSHHNNRQLKNITILNNVRFSNAPKKDAITTAVAQSQYDWIITTDADCTVPKYWLEAYDDYIQRYKPELVAGPVMYENSSSFFERFQSLDVLSLQGATIGSFGLGRPIMSNGANMAYQKSIFKALKGFDGNAHIASGDDTFVLEKFVKHNASKVGFLKCKSAVVLTSPVNRLKQLLQQRLRWASKTRRLKNGPVKLVGGIVFLGNLACIAIIPAILLDLITSRTGISLFVIKASIDFLLLFKSSRFFSKEGLLTAYPLSSVLYPVLSVYIALLSPFTSFKWKGRDFKT
jgi:biofilm PGA synthesis N-glycosyltransferase PgaC